MTGQDGTVLGYIGDRRHQDSQNQHDSSRRGKKVDLNGQMRVLRDPVGIAVYNPKTIKGSLLYVAVSAFDLCLRVVLRLVRQWSKGVARVEQRHA